MFIRQICLLNVFNQQINYRENVDVIILLQSKVLLYGGVIYFKRDILLLLRI